MASKYGHTYRNFYKGDDLSAAREFQRLEGMARELETSFGGLYRDTSSSTIAITSATKVDFTTATLTTGDINSSVANDRLIVRYGGKYRIFFQGAVLLTMPVAANFTLQFAVNGSLVAFPFLHPPVASGTVITPSFTNFLLVDDGDYIETFAQSAGAGNTCVFYTGCAMHLIGNRL